MKVLCEQKSNIWENFASLVMCQNALDQLDGRIIKSAKSHEKIVEST